MEEIATSSAPESTSPLSQAIVSGDLVFVSGQVPSDPDTGETVDGGIEQQTRQVFENLSAVLEASGSSLDNVVKSTVFLTDMGDFDGMNEIYREYMNEPYPARSAIGVAELAADIRVEIEMIAER